MSHESRNHGSLTTVAVATTAVPLVGANPGRVGLLISAPVSNRVTISNRPDVASGAGIVIHPGADPLYLTADSSGDFVQQTLFAVIASAGETIGVLEVLCQCRDRPLTR